MRFNLLLAVLAVVLLSGCIGMSDTMDSIDKATQTGDPSYCMDVAEGFEFLCYMAAAVESGNVSICDRMGNVSGVTCYIGVAAKTKNESICGLLESPEFGDSCYVTVAGETQNITICEKIIDAETRKECEEKVVENKTIFG